MRSFTIKPRNKLLSLVGLKERSPLVIWVRRFITFVLVSFAWIFFRANSLADARLLLERLFTGAGWQTPLAETLTNMGLGVVQIAMTLAVIALLLLIDHMLAYRDSDDSSAVLTRSGAFVYFVWIIFMVWTLLLSKDMISTFIYFQF